jgi:hypothetical protein
MLLADTPDMFTSVMLSTYVSFAAQNVATSKDTTLMQCTKWLQIYHFFHHKKIVFGKHFSSYRYVNIYYIFGNDLFLSSNSQVS